MLIFYYIFLSAIVKLKFIMLFIAYLITYKAKWLGEPFVRFAFGKTTGIVLSIIFRRKTIDHNVTMRHCHIRVRGSIMALPWSISLLESSIIFNKNAQKLNIKYCLNLKKKAFEGYLDRVRIGRYTQRNGIRRSEYSVIYDLSLENHTVDYKKMWTHKKPSYDLWPYAGGQMFL